MGFYDQAFHLHSSATFNPKTAKSPAILLYKLWPDQSSQEYPIITRTDTIKAYF